MKKIIITALILIGIISCNSKKTDNTEVTADTNSVNNNNTEISNNKISNNDEEIYQGYASNDMWSIYKTTMLEEEEKLFNEIDSIKDKKSFDEWQSKNPSKSSLVFAIDKFPTEEKAIELISYGADVNMKDDNDSRNSFRISFKNGIFETCKRTYQTRC